MNIRTFVKTMIAAHASIHLLKVSGLATRLATIHYQEASKLLMEDDLDKNMAKISKHTKTATRMRTNSVKIKAYAMEINPFPVVK